MHKKDKHKNKDADQVSVAEQSQVQQTRQNILMQVAELKKEIQVIQLNTLKAMQDSVDAAFKEQTSESLQQISQMQETVPDPVEEEPFDAGQQAMEIAEKSVVQAMQSAMESVQQAEKSLNQ